MMYYPMGYDSKSIVSYRIKFRGIELYPGDT